MRSKTSLHNQAYKFILKKYKKLFWQSHWTSFKHKFPRQNQSVLIHKIQKDWNRQTMNLDGKSIQKLFSHAQRQFIGFKACFSVATGPTYHIWDEQSCYQDGSDRQEFDEKKHQKQEKFKLHKYIQNIVGAQKPRSIFSMQKKAFNFMLLNNIDLNEANMIRYSVDIQRYPNYFDIQEQIDPQHSKIFNQLNRKCRLFYMRQSERLQSEKQQEQKQFFEKKKKKEQIKQRSFKEQKQKLECRKFICEQYMKQKANHFQDQSDSQSFSVSIEKPVNLVLNKKQRRIAKKQRKLKDFGLGILITPLTDQKQRKYYYCQKCFRVLRQDSKKHSCQIFPRKFYSENKSKSTWFIPIYAQNKKTFGWCLNCKKIAAKQYHVNEQDCQINFKGFIKKQPKYQIGQKKMFSQIQMVTQHFQSCHQLSNELNFYEQHDLQKIPVMENCGKIKLFSSYTLSAFSQLQKNTIFGPIGIDVLPIQLLLFLPWSNKYFSNIVDFNGPLLLVPIVNYNSAAFICNKNQAIFPGVFNGKVSLFGRTLRKIGKCEQLIVN